MIGIEYGLLIVAFIVGVYFWQETRMAKLEAAIKKDAEKKKAAEKAAKKK